MIRQNETFIDTGIKKLFNQLEATISCQTNTVESFFLNRGGQSSLVAIFFLVRKDVNSFVACKG